MTHTYTGTIPEERFNETAPMKARKCLDCAGIADRKRCFNETAPMKARKCDGVPVGTPQDRVLQ